MRANFWLERLDLDYINWQLKKQTHISIVPNIFKSFLLNLVFKFKFNLKLSSSVSLATFQVLSGFIWLMPPKLAKFSAISRWTYPRSCHPTHYEAELHFQLQCWEQDGTKRRGWVHVTSQTCSKREDTIVRLVVRG